MSSSSSISSRAAACSLAPLAMCWPEPAIWDAAAARLERARTQIEMARFDESEGLFRQVLDMEEDKSPVQYGLAQVLEHLGRYAEAEAFYEEAHRTDSDGCPLPTRMQREAFERVVREAADSLPDELIVHLKDVPILVQDLPERAVRTDTAGETITPSVLGLFVGRSLREQSVFNAPDLPPTIFIYQRNLERICQTREELIHEIFTTLYHELGHYLMSKLAGVEVEEFGFGFPPRLVKPEDVPHLVAETLIKGRRGYMPPFAEALDATQIDALANYVLSLSGGQADAAKVAIGKDLFHSQTAACYYCHGDNAKGRQDIGAANLTDKVWLWADVPGAADAEGKLNAVKKVITGGLAKGVMPAWEGRLSPEQIKLLTVYVHELGGGK